MADVQSEVTNLANRVKDNALPGLRRARGQLRTLDKRTRHMASQYPLWTLGAAIAFGYFFGRVVARR